MADLNFVSDSLVKIGDVEFELDWSPAIAGKTSTPGRYVVLKSPKIITTYQTYFAGRKISDIFEIGIQKGGSCALFNMMWKPRRHIAIELRPTQIPVLDDLASRVAADGRRFRHVLGMDQGDHKALLDLAYSEFGAEPQGVLDAVLDDASHLYKPSKTSFNTLFPLIRPGGVYVIEDWGWAHWPAFQDAKAHWHDEIALSNLVFEILMTAATRPDIITNVNMTSVNMMIERGPAKLSPVSFNVSELFVARGRAWSPFL